MNENAVQLALGAEDKLWRYMDFTKFMALLLNREIVFARADRLGDPFEGSYGRAVQVIPQDQVAGSALQTQALREIAEKINKWIVTCSYVSCWHINELESLAMWKVYSSSDQSVCIQSNELSILGAMDCGDLVRGPVKYIDHDKQSVTGPHPSAPYFHKHKIFEYEREYRLVFHPFPRNDDGSIPTGVETPSLVTRAVDLEKLVQAVFVSPSSPMWFADLVKKALSSAGVNRPVYRSVLDSDPVYAPQLLHPDEVMLDKERTET